MMRAHARSLLLLVVVGAASFGPSASTDAIGRGGFISGNQTLVSAGGVFQLGFFTPPGSADGRRYLGIWYANIPVHTIVWVANRQSPLVNSPGVLRLSADGRLVILDGQNATVWSSAAPTRDVTAGATAQLRGNGNFVLSVDGSGSDQSVAWQSFDYPTDTLLPGMKLGVDTRAGITRNITSWRTPSDPSPGPYTFKLVLGGMPEFFLFRATTPVYGSGPFNGQVLTGVPNLRSNDFAFEVVSTPAETYYSYSIIGDASLLSRFVVNGEGKMQRFVWIDGAAWSSFWYYPTDPCDSYATCGAFGYCDTGNSPLCSCLPGFQPRSPQQWNLRDSSSGCVRTANLTCGGDGFWVVNRMKLPDATNATVYASLTLDRCRQVCLSNCSCQAFVDYY